MEMGFHYNPRIEKGEKRRWEVLEEMDGSAT